MQTNVVVKSAEQKMLEKASAEYASKLRAILGSDVKANINLEKVPLGKIGTIAEFIKNEEGGSPEISTVKQTWGKLHVLYLHSDTSIKGEGFEIEYISE